MRTVLFIALGTIAAFAAGLAGTYFVLPKVAPDLVEAKRMQADSLSADSLSAGSPSTSGSLAMLPLDDAALGGTPAVLQDTMRLTGSFDTALGDSLAALRHRLTEYEGQIGTLKAQLDAAKTQRAQASDLAATIIKLEDRELARVVAQLDLDVLEALYAESSSRNRARLLGALAPARAAVFIRRATSSTAPADPEPLASTEATTEEPEPAGQDSSVPSPR